MKTIAYIRTIDDEYFIIEKEHLVIWRYVKKFVIETLCFKDFEKIKQSTAKQNIELCKKKLFENLDYNI